MKDSIISKVGKLTSEIIEPFWVVMSPFERDASSPVNVSDRRLNFGNEMIELVTCGEPLNWLVRKNFLGFTYRNTFESNRFGCLFASWIDINYCSNYSGKKNMKIFSPKQILYDKMKGVYKRSLTKCQKI